MYPPQTQQDLLERAFVFLFFFTSPQNTAQWGFYQKGTGSYAFQILCQKGDRWEHTQLH